ncbi:unnamed protein product [Closterium sp. Yama58-4]|nr:unnamed protein product [Closterium sp. Yama58-4]
MHRFLLTAAEAMAAEVQIAGLQDAGWAEQARGEEAWAEEAWAEEAWAGEARAEEAWADQARAEQARGEEAWAGEAWADQGWADQAWLEEAWAEEAWAEEAWAEGAWADQAWADQAWADQAWAEQARGEEAWAEEAWAEGAWAEEAWAEGAWAEEAWAEGAWAEEAWAEEAWAEEAWAAEAWAAGHRVGVRVATAAAAGVPSSRAAMARGAPSPSACHTPHLLTCGGHPSPFGQHPSPFGQYHYHVAPGVANPSAISASRTTNFHLCSASFWKDTPGEHSPLLGFLADGIPLYGPRGAGGELPSGVDECGGHVGDGSGGEPVFYHYHASSTAPYTVACLKGCVDSSDWGNVGSASCSQATKQYDYSSLAAVQAA